MRERTVSEHTPAPWSAEDPMDGWHVRADDPNRPGKRFHVCAIKPSHRSRDDAAQAMANARLIAAAPDLLEALRYYADQSLKDGGDIARQAIAKATGQ